MTTGDFIRHCIKDWLKEESVALRRADDDTE